MTLLSARLVNIVAAAVFIGFATPSQAGLLNIFQPKPKIVATVSLTEQKMYLAVTDARGHATQNFYDLSRRLTKTIDPLLVTSKFTYDAAGNRIRTTDRRGAVSGMTYDARNDLLTRTDPDGATSRFKYDSMSWLSTATDPRGETFRTSYSYDKAGRVIRLTDALEQVTSYEYDRVGNRVRETGPQGASHRTETTYDRLNRVTSITRAPGTAQSATVRQAYNGLGLVVSTTDALGRVTVLKYWLLYTSPSPRD